MPLPADLKASAQITLAQGSLIPSQTKLVLLGGKPVDLRPKGPDGKQGRNWALAPMLGAGASAWTLTAVAGADLFGRRAHAQRPEQGRSGDVRHALRPGGPGNRDLQDHLCRRDGADAAGAEELIGDPSLAGKPIKPIADEWQMDWETLCSWGAYCEPEPRRVTAAGSQQWAGNASWVGKTVQEMAAALNKTEEAICANAAHCEGGGTSETIITRTYKYVFGSPLFSVLRTGAGDLSLLAGRDVGMASLYGVYTAGTPTSLGAADARFNLARGHDGKTGVLGLMQLDGKYDAAMASYRAWYPDHGGNLLVDAARDVYGDAMGAAANSGVEVDWTSSLARYSSTMTGAWLWRQGSIGTPGVADIAPSWWINFGAYTVDSPTAPATRNRGWWVSPASARWAAATSASPPAATRACATRAATRRSMSTAWRRARKG